MTRIRIRCRGLALVAVGAALVAMGSGCRGRSPTAGGATNPKAQAARAQAEALVLEGVKSAATVQVALDADSTTPGAREPVVRSPNTPVPHVAAPIPPAPPVPPVPPVGVGPPARVASRPYVVIRERIATEVPFPTESAADDDALRMAQERIAARLQELDPPIRYTPSQSVVKNEYIRKDSRVVRRPGPSEQQGWDKHGFSGDQVYVEYDVELTAEQIRDLRIQDRLSDAMRGVIGLGVLAFAGFLFLRLDEWTKGYLTSWLAFVAAGLVGGIVAALLMI